MVVGVGVELGVGVGLADGVTVAADVVTGRAPLITSPGTSRYPTAIVTDAFAREVRVKLYVPASDIAL